MQHDSGSLAMPSRSRKPLLSQRIALWGVLLIWLAYTVLYTVHPGDSLTALLEFVPGLLAVSLLTVADFSRQELFLHAAPVSRKGLILLGISFLFMPMILLTGRWTGWNPLGALIYAPASGISQELFFRAALLPVLLANFKAKPFLALMLHAFLFALWHVPTAYMTAPLGGLIGVTAVTFVCGLLWGKQVQHDGTVIWLTVYHSLILVINSFFTWV